MNVNVFWIHEYCYCGELNFHLILRRKKINIWKLNIKQILIVHIKINILFFYLNNITKETFLKNSNIAIFRNMSNITGELIFTSRQTMQIGFATYLDISHHCIDSSCAEFSFVFFFSMFTDAATNEVCYANNGDIWVLYNSVLLWTRSYLQNMFNILLGLLLF